MTLEEAKKILSDMSKLTDLEQKATGLVLKKLDEFENMIQITNQADSVNLPGEIWRDIAGYEGIYQVSTHGRVKNIRWSANRILKINHGKRGYDCVHLCKEGIRKLFTIHVLVARTFIPNPENKPEVNHKDANKLNNNVENLEWVTRSENLRHAVQMGLRKVPKVKRSFNAKLSDDDVRYIRKNYKPYDKIFGGVPLSKKFNISRNCLQDVIKGKSYKDAT